jgi:hypothetical protein
LFLLVFFVFDFSLLFSIFLIFSPNFFFLFFQRKKGPLFRKKMQPAFLTSVAGQKSGAKKRYKAEKKKEERKNQILKKRVSYS